MKLILEKITITRKYENNKNNIKKYQTHGKTKQISKIKKCRLGKVGENPPLPDLLDHLIRLQTPYNVPAEPLPLLLAD